MTRDDATCPSCDEPLAINGTFCHACGWDAAVAASDDAYLDGVDVPDGYATNRDEPPRPRRFAGLPWIAAVILVTILIVMLLRGGAR